MIVVGGVIPPQDVDELLKAGASAIFPPGTVIADARVPIEEFEVQVGTVLTPEERENDIETLGGLVFSVAGRVPIRGEVLRHEASGIEFEVVDADPRRIRRLRLCNLPVRPDADG